MISTLYGNGTFKKRDVDIHIIFTHFLDFRFVRIAVREDRIPPSSSISTERKPASDVSPGEITSFSTFDRSSATTSRVGPPIKRVHPSNNNNDSTSGGNSVRFPPFSPCISPSPPKKKKMEMERARERGREAKYPHLWNLTRDKGIARPPTGSDGGG